MSTLTHSRPLAWAVFIALTFVVLAPAEKLPADSTECVAVDQNDMPRECTFLEEHGSCLVAALDSYEASLEDADGLVERLSAEIAVQVDLFACNVTIPLALLKSIVD